ncbi:MAG: class IV adenylate cyclase, partial [Bacteroidota bacterium]
MHLNIEIKAHCPDPERVRQILKDHQAYFRGIDHQVDTYFKVPNGRLKLREGNIENHLIHYERPDQAGPKASHVSLFKTEPDSSLKFLLTKALGLLTIVDKKRSIYFIDNVKFHID